MAAPQIPNLFTLRGTPRSRGPARRRGHINGKSAGHRSTDLDVQSTDTDAAVSRLSAVSMGYITDPYASLFVQESVTRRLPIINRGTYCRTIAIDILINNFLLKNQCQQDRQMKQIISLGAGTDTRYFRLRDAAKHTNLIYHEFDFPTVSLSKRKIFMNNAELSKKLASENPWSAAQSTNENIENKEWGLNRQDENSDKIIYCFHPIDLREIAKTGSEHSFAGLCIDIPTLILSECCLCYMNVMDSNNLVRWFTEKIPSIGIIFYEPIGADDSFGQTMVSNLATRNIVMPSLEQYKTLDDQRMRLSELGFDKTNPKNGCEAETIERIWEEWVPATEKQRLDRLEGLDEVEEWQMLARHYAVAWGWRAVAGEWKGFAKQPNHK